MLKSSDLCGYAGNEPEVLKETKHGKFIRFSLATTKKYTDEQGNIQQITQWHTVYASNGRGTALAAHLKKGALVSVVGELRYSQWKDKETGQTRTAAGVYADGVKFLGSKPAPKEAAPDASTPAPADIGYDTLL